ncbi:hypothetical protein LSTR_LSTR015891 [Laodelphax striatellus]|uniref:Uncharacterized protein n=1 Tax=Laodelphax striatellus TaxID=195883 RepID=A0A482WPX3_LAOST|nr:hypothetical protein LSTR_LSTR015891 [Laodelphax striatellus]
MPINRRQLLSVAVGMGRCCLFDGRCLFYVALWQSFAVERTLLTVQRRLLRLRRFRCDSGRRIYGGGRFTTFPEASEACLTVHPQRLTAAWVVNLLAHFLNVKLSQASSSSKTLSPNYLGCCCC